MRKGTIFVIGFIVAVAGLFAAPQVANAQNAEVSFDVVLQWLNIKGLTKYDTVVEFRKDDSITRGEAAKFYAQFGELFAVEAGTYDQCEFSDLAGYDSTLVPFIDEVCSMGLIKGSQGMYMPNGLLTEIEAATIISRAISGFKDETKEPWYVDYYTHAQALGLITTETMASANSTAITREKLGRWMFVADKARDIDQADATIGVSANITTQSGDTTDISGQIGVEVEQQGVNDEDVVTGVIPYSQDLVNTALAQGQQLVLYFRAGRCPLCLALDADLEVNADQIPSTLAIFTIDYDKATSLKADYEITSQHTLVYLDSTGDVMFSTVKQEVTLEEMIQTIVTGNVGGEE